MIGSVLKGAFSKKGVTAMKSAFSKKTKAVGRAAETWVRGIADDVVKAYKPGGAMSALQKSPTASRATYSINRDLGVRSAKKMVKASETFGGTLASGARPFIRLGQAGGRTAAKLARTRIGKATTRGMFGVGAIGMVGYQVMKGGMDGARDMVHERYMQDYTYSRSVLHNSRVGLSSGTNRMLKYGGHQGLSLGLSRTRHGRR